MNINTVLVVTASKQAEEDARRDLLLQKDPANAQEIFYDQNASVHPSGKN